MLLFPRRWLAAGILALAALAPRAFAQSSMDQRLAELEASIAQLRREHALSQRQREEVRDLVDQVVADAQSRASLQGAGAAAGHDGKRFFMGSADGRFKLFVEGHLQFRYIWNHMDHRPAPPGTDADGFQFRRARLIFSGEIGDPSMFYRVGFQLLPAGGVAFQDIFVGKKFEGGWEIQAGRCKLPFLREELVGGPRQTAVERSEVHRFFTLSRAEQVQVAWKQDMVRVMASINDGANGENDAFNADGVEIGFTSRIDVKLAGDWKQWDDYQAWSGEDLAAFLGAAMHHESGDGNEGQAFDIFSYTFDAAIEFKGCNLSAAFVGSHIQYDDGDLAGLPAGTPEDQFGVILQAGIFVVPDKLEPFARFEWIADDSGVNDDAMFATAGVNWFLNKHNAKFTVDVVWAFDAGGLTPVQGLPAYSAGSGLIPPVGVNGKGADRYDQIAVRVQFQLLF